MPFLKVDPPSDSDYNLKRDGISQSIFSNFGCRKKLLLVLNRWTMPNKSGTFFGTAFHDAYEYTHKRGIENFNLKRFDKELAESQLREMKGLTSELTIQKCVEDYKLLRIVFPEYLKFHKDDAKKKWNNNLEKEFNFLYKGVYRFRGKIDGIYQDKKGKNWIIEHKTKSRIDEEVLNKVLSFNFQNLYYILACENEFKMKISGVLYDIIRKPGTKPKKDETDTDYATRLVKEINAMPEHYFKRIEIIYSENEKKEFESELQMKLTEIENILSGKSPVYRNECICERPFPCTFLNACSSGSMAGYIQKDTLFTELTEEE